LLHYLLPYYRLLFILVLLIFLFFFFATPFCPHIYPVSLLPCFTLSSYLFFLHCFLTLSVFKRRIFLPGKKISAINNTTKFLRFTNCPLKTHLFQIYEYSPVLQSSSSDSHHFPYWVQVLQS